MASMAGCHGAGLRCGWIVHHEWGCGGNGRHFLPRGGGGCWGCDDYRGAGEHHAGGFRLHSSLQFRYHCPMVGSHNRRIYHRDKRGELDRQSLIFSRTIVGMFNRDAHSLLVGLVSLVCLLAVCSQAGIIPAIIPAGVPTANKRGNSGVFQLASNTSAASAGVLYCDDGSGNLTTSGCSSGGVAVPFNTITSGTNTAATMTVSTGATFQTSGTAIINFGTVGATTPALVGTAAAITASTCTAGQMAFASDATAGQNWYFCTATNTWTQQLNNGSAGGITNSALAFAS